MSHAADKAREERWLKQGNVRLHVRITKDADDILTLACQRFRLERRQVIERLLRGEISQADMQGMAFGLSRAELPWAVGA